MQDLDRIAWRRRELLLFDAYDELSEMLKMNFNIDRERLNQGTFEKPTNYGYNLEMFQDLTTKQIMRRLFLLSRIAESHSVLFIKNMMEE